MNKWYFLSLALLLGCNNHEATPANNETAAANKEDWSLVPFVKEDSVNPVLVPDSTQSFVCPILKKPVLWEAKDVFNPAAVVRNDTIWLLYRAEDRIGKYAGTSRIGLAWSIDGLHFKKNPAPVFYPDNDAQKKWEWEG